MMARVKIAAVSYLNTIPFVYGIEWAESTLSYDLVLSPPSQCPAFIENGLADIALVTVAEIPNLKTPVRLISDFCLGVGDGGVRTVTLLTNCELDQIKTIYLDPDSRTTNLLTQILCREFWHINPEFVMRYQHGVLDTEDTTSGYVLIGDRVFDYENRFKNCHDLSVMWRQHTGLSFVFAAWVATENVSQQTIDEFNKTLLFGVQHITQAVMQHSYCDKQQAMNYLTKNLDFNFDKQKRQALALFWDKGLKCHERVNPG